MSEHVKILRHLMAACAVGMDLKDIKDACIAGAEAIEERAYLIGKLSDAENANTLLRAECDRLRAENARLRQAGDRMRGEMTCDDHSADLLRIDVPECDCCDACNAARAWDEECAALDKEADRA